MKGSGFGVVKCAGDIRTIIPVYLTILADNILVL